MFVSSAPTFRATAAALSGILHHFQWKYVVVVVEESQRFYVDLAAYITYSLIDDRHLDIQRVVQLNRAVTSNNVQNRLRVIAETSARGKYCNCSCFTARRT